MPDESLESLTEIAPALNDSLDLVHPRFTRSRDSLNRSRTSVSRSINLSRASVNRTEEAAAAERAVTEKELVAATDNGSEFRNLSAENLSLKGVQPNGIVKQRWVTCTP